MICKHNGCLDDIRTSIYHIRYQRICHNVFSCLRMSSNMTYVVEHGQTEEESHLTMNSLAWSLLRMPMTWDPHRAIGSKGHLPSTNTDTEYSQADTFSPWISIDHSDTSTSTDKNAYRVNLMALDTLRSVLQSAMEVRKREAACAGKTRDELMHFIAGGTDTQRAFLYCVCRSLLRFRS
jgi:hypothetical protein